MPQGEELVVQYWVPELFWIASQLICVVLRAVTMLSYASFANCLAIMSCCEVCVEAMASPKTPSRLTIPTVSTNIETTTSISENPRSAGLRTRDLPLYPILDAIIDVSIDKCPPKRGRAAIRECDPCRPIGLPPGHCRHSPSARGRPLPHPNFRNRNKDSKSAPNRLGKSKPLLRLRWCWPPYSQSQSRSPLFH